MARVNKAHQSQLKKPFVGEGPLRSHEQGNGCDLIQVFLKGWQLTLKLDSDHTWTTCESPPGNQTSAARSLILAPPSPDPRWVILPRHLTSLSPNRRR